MTTKLNKIQDPKAVTKDERLKQFVVPEAPKNAPWCTAHDNYLPDNYNFYLSICPPQVRKLPPNQMVEYVKQMLEVERGLKSSGVSTDEWYRGLRQVRLTESRMTSDELKQLDSLRAERRERILKECDNLDDTETVVLRYIEKNFGDLDL